MDRWIRTEPCLSWPGKQHSRGFLAVLQVQAGRLFLRQEELFLAFILAPSSWWDLLECSKGKGALTSPIARRRSWGAVHTSCINRAVVITMMMMLVVKHCCSSTKAWLLGQEKESVIVLVFSALNVVLLFKTFCF